MNGLFQEIHDPQVDITSWQSIFQSPVLLNKLIIIQDEYNGEFYLELIRKACKRYVQIDSYDADGILSEEPVRILLFIGAYSHNPRVKPHRKAR